MTVIRWAGFLGENRAIHPKLLADGVGTVSLNQKPGRGDLRPWKAASSVATIPSGRQTIYRMGRDIANAAQYWCSWSSIVHAVRGSEAGDTAERTYFTGDGEPKVMDSLSLSASSPQTNPTVTRPLGIPRPTSAPTLTAYGGSSSNTELRYYGYTFVNDWGWEGQPSPLASITCKTDDSVTFNWSAMPPAGNYNISIARIYRSEVGVSGSSDLFFLRDVTVTAGTTTDDRRALGDALETTDWQVPPADLSYLTAMWNGMLAGITGNAVRFCEPFAAYAWPQTYEVLPPDGKPVALGVFGQSLLVLTTSRPLLVGGTSPDSLDQQPLAVSQACIAPQSVASMGNGVAWACPDGLMFYGNGGARLLTAGLMTREDWQALAPSSVIGKFYEGLYFGSYDPGSGRKGFFIDTENPSGLFFFDAGYSVMHNDELLDDLFVLSGTSVQRWDSGSAMTVTAKSKVFRQSRLVCFSCAKVIADTFPVTFKVYADGVLKHTQTVANEKPFRLPSGYLATAWQLELSGTNSIQGVSMATSIAELR